MVGGELAQEGQLVVLAGEEVLERAEARLGPALFVGGSALSQLWVFLVAPLVGGSVSAFVYQFLYPKGEDEASVEPAPEEQAR